jgi:hypothetical protein
MFMFKVLAFNLLHLKGIIDSYVDIQLARMEMANTQQEALPPLPFPKLESQDWTTVPVSMPHKDGYVYAKVSVIDYETVVAVSPIWRKSSSGYAIHINGDGATTYMHKLIHGGSAKHLNGDRLDNRRSNLCSTSKKRKQPFEIHRPDSSKHIDEMNTFKSTDPALPCMNGFCKIEFPKGKYYVGDVEGGIPHGYGVMFKRDPPYEQDGMWVRGEIQVGSIKHLNYVPKCMCPDKHPCPFREVTKVEAVHNGFKVVS